VHLVLAHELLRLPHADRGLAFLVLDDEGHLGAAELALVLVEIQLEAVLHVLADLRKDAGHRRQEPDAQLLLRLSRGRRHQRHRPPYRPTTEPLHSFLLVK
jgi:hypothetical protein